MKVCKTIRGVEFLIDDEDYEKVQQFKWRLCRGYVVINKRKSKCVHRLILNITDPSIIIDHINRNPLDNRKSNLRIANSSLNAMNRGKPVNNLTSRFKGVSWRKERKKWRAYITANKKTRHLGTFNTEEEAAKAYNEAALIYHKEFACLNEIS